MIRISSFIEFFNFSLNISFATYFEIVPNSTIQIFFIISMILIEIICNIN